MKIQRNYIEKSVRKAIFEDLGKQDITSNLIFKKKTVTAKVVFRKNQSCVENHGLIVSLIFYKFKIKMEL